MSLTGGARARTLYCPTCEQEWETGPLCPRDGTRLVRLAAEVDPLVGRVLDERFTIESKLGEGGMGAVYRARQHSVGRGVAIKVVNPSLVADALAIKRFLREAKLASQLAHPNIVSVMDFGQTSDGLFYLVMELVAGRTLHEVLLAEGRMSLERVVRIGSQICDALEGAHAVPMMHRDLKPANIMLMSSGRDLVKVLDFGLAKSLAMDAQTTTMTNTGALLGTPTFMPPEVANGLSVDERADLYSLGCILFMMITGRPPFVTDSIPEMIALHGTARAPLLTGAPMPFVTLIGALLEKTPELRPPSAAAARAALEAALVASVGQPNALVDTLDIPLPPDPLVPPSRETVQSMLEPRGAPVLGSISPPDDHSVTQIRRLTPVPGRPAAAGQPSLTEALPRPRRSGVLIGLVAATLLVVAAIVAVLWSKSGRPPERDVVMPMTGSAAPSDAAITIPTITPIVDPAVGVIDAGVPLPDTVVETIDPLPLDAGVAMDAPRKRITKPPHSSSTSGRVPPDAALVLDAPF